MEGVTLTQKEQTRLQVLNSVLADQVPVCQAAEVLGVSERHMRRILAAYRKEGAAALAHGNRGRRPANTTTETKMTYVVQLARTRYAGTNHTHLTELLMDREGIDLSRSTVRRILVSAGVDSPRRRRPPIYPVAPSPTPFRCPHAVHRCPSVDSGLSTPCPRHIYCSTESQVWRLPSRQIAPKSYWNARDVW